MKALILNSGMGTRMGTFTSGCPKCMAKISQTETILSRQLSMLAEVGVDDVVMTTGYCDDIIVRYCQELDLALNITFVKNPEYGSTNYIYSIYCARALLDDDIMLLHGDMVMEGSVLEDVLETGHSCMAVSTTVPLPDKDFKAVIKDGRIRRVSTQYASGAVAAQPLYKLRREDWRVWLDRISLFCESGRRGCYAEEAFNEAADACCIYPLDVGGRLCNEIDDARDLEAVSRRLREVEGRLVYMCFSTDVLHSGHIAILKKARKLGKLVVGVLSDQAVASYKRYPLLPFKERKALFENIAGVYKVVRQEGLSYKENLSRLKPAYVVHGDDWADGFQKPIRDEVISILTSYGGQLVEYPYAQDETYKELEARARVELSMPDIRRGRLRKTVGMKGLVTAMEAHDGLTGLIVENTVIQQGGGGRQFDAIWVSSLCDSTARGKPDIELVDLTSRFRTVEDLMEVTTKPIIFDGDTGGRTEHFAYTVRTFERMGVSMVVIEDKTGLKRNSLFGTEVVQEQDSIESFCSKISAGKRAQKGEGFMICARVESLILGKGMRDALERARAYVQAGADAVMIHSREKGPDEIFRFVRHFRETDSNTPLVVVPTSFDTVTEEEFKRRGVNIVIYANQLMRAIVPAAQKAAETILRDHRASGCDGMIMPFDEIIRMIPEGI